MEKYLFLISFLILIKFTTSPSCSENDKGCIKCNFVTNLCIKCKSDILTPDDEGGCIGIQKCIMGTNNCEQCSEDGALCKICENGYFPDGNGACSNTNNCKLSLKGECIECLENYFLITKIKSCKYLFSNDLKNCKVINVTNGFCDICEEGFFFNEGDRKCIKTENCYNSAYGICISCNKGYYLDKKNEKCLKQENQWLHCKETLDNEFCDKCDEDYFFSLDGKCVETNFCSKSIGNTCIECINNYYLTEKNNICSYDKNCVSGDKYTGYCNSCKNNFYLDKKDGKCKTNKENNEFLKCKIAETICLECENGYYLSLDNLCTSTKNCSEVENGVCINCNEDYYLGLDHKCTIYENCTYSDEDYECIECKDGFYFDNRNRSCQINTEEFEHCKHSNQFGGYCTECKDGYYLTIRDKICRSNEEEGLYYKCKETDYNEFCHKCVEGYYVSTGDHRCSKIDGCKFIKNENECEECEEGNCLIMKNLTCVWNFEITEEYEKIYYKCNYTNIEGTKCEVCEDNYSLSEEGLCVNNFDCEEFENNICIQCKKENIYGMYQCLNKELGCVDTFTENCKRCDITENFYECTECLEGYELDEFNNCIEKN